MESTDYVKIVLEAIDHTTAVVKKVRADVDAATERTQVLSDTFMDVGQSMVMAGAMVSAISIPALSFLNDAIQTGMEFERTLKQVQAVSGATADEFAEVSKEIRDIASSSVFTASEVNKAAYSLASAGMSAREISDALDGVINYAVATDTEVAKASEMVVLALKAFQMDASKATYVADVYTAAISNSMATSQKLAYSMKYAGTYARALGYDLEDTTGALMTLYDASKSGEQAGTYLRALYQALAKYEVQENLRAIGVEVKTATGEFRALEDIMTDLAAKDLSIEDFNVIFDVEAGTAAKDLSDLIADYKGNLKDIANSEGESARIAEDMKNTIFGVWASIKSGYEEIKLSVFDDANSSLKELLIVVRDSMPALKEFAVAMASAMTTVALILFETVMPLIDLFNSLPAPVQQAIGALAGLISIAAAIVGPLLVFGGVVAMAISSILTLASTLAGLGITWGAITATVTAAVPILAAAASGIVAAIGSIALPILAVVAAVYILKKAWDSNFLGIQDKTKAVYEYLKNTFGNLKESLSGHIDEMGGLSGLMEKALKTAIWGPLVPVKLLWDSNFLGMRDIVIDVLNDVIDKFEGLDDRFYAAGKGIITSFKKGFDDKVQEFKNDIKGLLTWIRRHLPSSPAKEGPLSDLNKVGVGFVRTIADGIDKNLPLIKGSVNAMTYLMSDDLEPYLNSGDVDNSSNPVITNNSSANDNRTINIILNGVKDAKTFSNDFKRILEQEKNMG